MNLSKLISFDIDWINEEMKEHIRQFLKALRQGCRLKTSEGHNSKERTEKAEFPLNSRFTNSSFLSSNILEQNGHMRNNTVMGE